MRPPLPSSEGDERATLAGRNASNESAPFSVPSLISGEEDKVATEDAPTSGELIANVVNYVKDSCVVPRKLVVRSLFLLRTGERFTQRR